VKTLFALMLLALIPGAAAAAESLSCPDLASARLIGNCPSEKELRYTFVGHCSDNARIYSGTTDECTDFERYRRMKNIALWESADGRFQSYVSCDLPETTVKSLRASRIMVARKGNVTHLTCGYPQGVSFVFRSRAMCTVEGDGKCSGAECQARCE
jgi:hypothetical protein